MEHPLNSGVRLVSPPARLMYRIFGRANPRGWADYHSAPERRGTLWVHCHGPARRGGANLEFIGVPTALRAAALQLMFALVAEMRAGRRFRADEDFAAPLSSKRQSFMQIGTLRATAWSDRDHAGMLRVVDYREPLQSGFPLRLFASHIAARATLAEDPARKEALCRKSLAVFAGDFTDLADAIGVDGSDADLTELQNRCNLLGYTGLAEALCAQNRHSEACGIIVDAIARCPGWARGYREQLLASGAPENLYTRFWHDADIAEIATRRQPDTAPAPTRSAAPRPAGNGGFGSRAPDPYDELLKRG
ncbi:MAG: hypothetical protein JSU82_01775 [Rhodospirillales bacterium]|nr:MAG: hypothetical protein JSU82_01775 [Rhodospirillales bacterium]